MLSYPSLYRNVYRYKRRCSSSRQEPMVSLRSLLRPARPCASHRGAWHRAFNILQMRSPTQYYGPVRLVDKALGLNGTYHRWDAVMSTRYTVSTEGTSSYALQASCPITLFDTPPMQGWHNVAFQVCSYSGAMPLAKMDGQVTFRNPYGYLPAEVVAIYPCHVIVVSSTPHHSLPRTTAFRFFAV